MKKTLKNAVSQAAEEAAGLLPDLRIELSGSREAVVDCCRGIIEYNESCIRLGGARQIVKFTGSGNVTIPVSLNGDAIVAINADAFASCENITSFSSENSRWYANDSALYTLDGDGIGDTLVAYPSGVWSPAFIMPEGVDKIAPYAFANATQLESVVFPDNITSIGAYAFKNSYVSNNGNDDENYLLFVIGGSVDSIDDNAFTGMNVMPYILCAGGCNSFDGMPGITLTNEREVDIPVEKLGIENDVLYRINDDAAEIVAYIGRDSDVITPNKLGGYTVKSIGFAAYQNFAAQSLTVSEDIEQISSCAFRFCSSLKPGASVDAQQYRPLCVPDGSRVERVVQQRRKLQRLLV